MIWYSVSAAAFTAAYAGYQAALSAAIAAAATRMVRTSPQAALRQGTQDVQAAAGMLVHAQALLGPLIADAAELGARAAGGQPSSATATLATGQLSGAVANIARGDLMKANQVIRNQSIRFSQAAMTMAKPVALLHATSELGGDAFTQLDRAGRQFDSIDLVVWFVRLAAAQTYLKEFMLAAQAAGAGQALVHKPDADPALVDLADIDPAWFHPNATTTLSLP